MAHLLGAISGNRYCLPGIGENDDWKIPLGQDSLPLQYFLGQRLLQLREDDQGAWRPFRDERGQYVQSSAPVSSFVGSNGEARTFGTLQEVMNLDGSVKVHFGIAPLREPNDNATLLAYRKKPFRSSRNAAVGKRPASSELTGSSPPVTKRYYNRATCR